MLTSLPIKIMTEMRDKGAVAFIGGPEDTCVSEALVAAAWDLPMISFVRMFPSISLIALSFSAKLAISALRSFEQKNVCTSGIPRTKVPFIFSL
jgi:hypothetical protein